MGWAWATMSCAAHAGERGQGAPGLFVRQHGQARIGVQKRQHGPDARLRPGNRAVDAFVRQKQCAFDVIRFATGLQRGLQVCEVGQINEFVEGGGEVRSGRLHGVRLSPVGNRVRTHKSATPHQRLLGARR